MTCKYSIIVPVYNSERTIERCVVSILSQTERDFELLLIDDGSTDGSGKICDYYANKDCRVRVCHKKNGGVSSARNVGINNANGEWVTFVDSDDWISEDFLSAFGENDLNKKTLYVQGSRKYRGEGKYETWMQFDSSIINMNDVRNYRVLNEVLIYGTPWAKLYNLKLLKSWNIRFNETMNLHEDHVFYFEYIANVTSIGLVANNGYVYNVEESENSLSRGKFINYKAELDAMNALKLNFYAIQKKFSLSSSRFREVKTLIYGLPLRAFVSVLRNADDKNLIKEVGRSVPVFDSIRNYRPYGVKHVIAKYFYLVMVLWSCV